MKEIYMNYDITKEKSNQLSDCTDIIKNDSNKIKDLIVELNQYWKGSAATTFTNKIEEYIELLNKNYVKFAEDKDEFTASSASYKALNEKYLNKEI